MAIIAHWKEGTYSEYAKNDAQKIYEELRSIGKNNTFESVTAQEFVDYARNNTSSESHKCFEWNDSVAAESYRREQANRIRCSLVTYELENPQVTINDDDDNKKEIPLFINPRAKEFKEHAPTEIVMANQTLRSATLEQALKELQSFQKKYSFLKELEAVFVAINQVITP